MHLTHVPEFLKVCMYAGRVPFLWGEAGIGKSQVVYDTAQGLNSENDSFGMIDLRLGQMEEGDLIGIPRVREVNGKFYTVYAAPEWWPEPNEELFKKTGEAKYAKKGFLFLDEFNRAGTTSVIQAMFQLILGHRNHKTGKIERFMHQHKLPEGWFPVCAGNPESGEYVVQTLDTAMLDRFVQVVLSKDHKSIMKWMRANLKNQEITAFLASSPGQIGTNPKINLVVKSSPRSFEFVDDLLACMTEKHLHDFGSEVFAGCLGQDTGKLLYQHILNNLVKPIPADEIYNTKDFKGLYESQIKPLIEGDKKRLELLNESLMGIVKLVEEKEPTKKQAENVHAFLGTLPKDMVLDFITEVTKSENCVPIYMSILDNDETMYRILEAIGHSREEVNKAIADLEEILKKNKAGK